MTPLEQKLERFIDICFLEVDSSDIPKGLSDEYDQLKKEIKAGLAAGHAMEKRAVAALAGLQLQKKEQEAFNGSSPFVNGIERGLSEGILALKKVIG